MLGSAGPSEALLPHSLVFACPEADPAWAEALGTCRPSANPAPCHHNKRLTVSTYHNSSNFIQTNYGSRGDWFQKQYKKALALMKMILLRLAIPMPENVQADREGESVDAKNF